jgi:uncharacterized protein (TIGR02996 family)
MTDHESFLRAILDRPGDDAPRLVYADWLDERGEPGGDFLRAEVELFRLPGGSPEFKWSVGPVRVLGAALDSVWAARVSRPPVGVCSAEVRFDCMHLPPGPPLGSADIEAFEVKHWVTLPATYWAFLLNQNGGYPYPDRFARPNAAPDELPVRITAFAAIAPRDGIPSSYRGAKPMWGVFSARALGIGPLMAIAADGLNGALFLTTVGPDAGRVLYHRDWIHQHDNADRYVSVAASLPEFLARPFTSDPEWTQHIIRGDLAGFRAWLDSGGDPNAVHEDNEFTPLMYALDWQRTDMIRELLAAGARPTGDLRQLRGYRHNRKIAGIIDWGLRGQR